MKAIPTRYKGVQFRSRLEARWAAMFDLLDWRWEYEPIDLEGYIPDFILRLPAGNVLAEVKPEFTSVGLMAAVPKIEKSGWEPRIGNYALILGSTHALEDEYYDAGGVLCQLCETDSSNNYPGVWDAGVWFTCANCRRPSLYHATMGWECMVCGKGEYGIPHAGGDGHLGSAPDIEAMWAEAGNVVQWKPRR